VICFCIHGFNDVCCCLSTSHIYELPICLLWKLQDVVRKHHMVEQSCSTILESFLALDTNTKSFGSVKAGPSLVNSNGFFIFSAEDAFSTIDFSKAPIDDGVVDSPLCNDNKQTGVSSPSPFKSSRWNGIRKASPQRYKRSRQGSQFYGPSHVASAMEMTNASENSPCFLEPASEVELQAPCTDDSTIVLNMEARPNPNCSSNIVLQRGIGRSFWHAEASRVLNIRLAFPITLGNEARVKSP
jgi:hypothetical protein